ncbi:MAG: PAS domain S-box protein [bacterium]|jgi:PAS domain S-box-containing protein|nr:PAS domain S-box protein [Betaproteobacteria bacterium]
MASVSPLPLPSLANTKGPAGLWAILGGILLFVVLATFAASRQNDARALAEFRHAADRYQTQVERQLRAYQALTLTMAAGLSTGTGPISRARFEQLASALTGSEALGPLGAVSLLDRVEDRRLGEWAQGLRSDYPDLELKVARQGIQVDDHLLVRNRWPIWMAIDAIGRDMGTQRPRVAAAMEADDARLPQLSQIFVEPTLDGPASAYVFMAPVGLRAAAAPGRQLPPQSTPSLDATAARQWVSVLLLAEQLFQAPIAVDAPALSVHVVDVDAPDSEIQVAYVSPGHRGGSGARFTESRMLSAMGRSWHVTYATTPAFEAAHRDLASAAIGTTGLLMSIGVLLAFLRLRRAQRAASVQTAHSEARFEQLNAMLPIGVFQADAAGLLTDANAAACALAAAPRETLLGRGYLRRIRAADRRWLLDEWRAFLAGGTSFRAEHRLRTTDGGEHWVLTEVVRQATPDGQPAGFVGTSVDISTRRAFELDLLHVQQRAIAAEARLMAAIDAMDSGFALYGPDERLVICNARLRDFFGPLGGQVRHGMDHEGALRLLHRALSGTDDRDAQDAFVRERTAFDDYGISAVEQQVGGRWFRVTRRRTTSGDTIALRTEITREKLRELEVQRLAAVASQTADGVALIDATGRIEWVNASYERLTGFGLDEIRNLRGRDFLIGPMTDPVASGTITAGVESSQPYQVEVVHYTKQREPIWFEVRSQPRFDAAGRPIGSIQTRFDIGKRKAAEAAVKAALSEQRRAEARLRESIDSLDAGFSLFDRSERLVVCNNLYVKILGSAARRVQPGMLKAELIELLWQQSSSATGPASAAIRDAWVGARLAEFRAANVSTEYPIGARWYSTSHRRTPAGDTVALRIDITDAKTREEEHRRLAMVARETNDGVQILDTEGRAVWVNAAFERMTGYSFEQVRGRTGTDYLVGPGTNPGTMERISNRMASLLPYHVEVLNYTRAGEPGWWDVRGQPLFDDNGLQIGYFQTRFDITARKAAEAAASNALAEQQLAETRLLQAIESLDEAFALYDGNERLVICNERNRRLAGDTQGRIRVGMTKREVLEVIARAQVPDSEGAAAREAYIQSRLAEHRTGNLQVERRIGQGWYRVTLRRTPMGDVVATHADITSSREREAQLEKLSLVASRTANSVMICDAANRVEWVNESFERQTGYAVDEVLGRSAAELLTGPLTDTALVAEMARMTSQGVGYRVELINYRKNGDPYWASVERQPIRDECGQIVRWIRLSLDVSERKRAELALRASEVKNRMLADVVQQTTAAVITKDLDNRITTWNRGAERLYGYTAEQAVGRLSHELLNPDITPQYLKGLLERVRIGCTDVNRLQHQKADATRIDIESSHGPQLDDCGRLVGRITVIRDITEQLRAQRSIEAARAAAEQAQVAMSTFLSNMSHELRTPMHAILSYARLGQERISKGTPEKTLQYLDRIEQSGGRLLALLNDLLDLSRLEAGRMPIDAGRHELSLAVDAAILEVSALAQSRLLAVERAGLRSLPAWFDPLRIAQVLANVLGNAVKFSSQGGTITVSLGRATATDGTGLAEVVIADRGIGIPESERQSIFDKFTQSSKTRTGAGGTGLGLAISRELVLAHGGEIRAEDNPGGGTRFIFTLPEQDPSATRTGQDDEQPETPQAGRRAA